MKAKLYLLLFPVLLIVITLLAFHEGQDHKILFEKAVYAMETKADLQEAIILFDSLIRTYPEERAYAANAQFHIGLCYEKLGNQQAQKAQNAYKEVIRQYGDQKEVAASARERLSRLALMAEKTAITTIIPKFTKIKIPTEISWDMHLSPDGKKVSLVDDNKLWILPLFGKLGKDIPGSPQELNTKGVRVQWTAHTWSGDGNWIAFNEDPSKEQEEENIGNQSIYVVSSKGGIPKKVYENYRELYTVNYRIGLSPDGKILAFSSVDLESKKQHIYTIPVNGGAPILLVKKEAREPVFSPNGKFIAFVEDKDMGRRGGDLYIIPAQGGIPQKVADAENASSPIWSPDGDVIAFLDYGEKEHICFIPVEVNGEAAGDLITIDAPEGIDGIWLLTGWSHDNKIGAIFERSGETGLYTLPTTGGKAMQVALGGGQPRWSPDGKRIFCINDPEEENSGWQGAAITSIPAEGGSFETVPIQSDIKIGIPGFGAGNRVSPDGKKIVFSGKTQKDPWFYLNNHIWLLPVEGGKPEQLTEAPEQLTDMFPCWSPDGKFVAFLRARIPEKAPELNYIHTNIFVIQVNTGKQTTLTKESDSVCFGPIEWSPDGKYIAFFSRQDISSDSADLKIISANGDGESRIIGKVIDPHPGMQFAWSPDSKQIAFNGRDGKVIKIISVEDGSTVKIKTGLVDSNIGDRLDWSPDGKKFVFVGGKGESSEFWLVENFLPLEKLAPKPESSLIRLAGIVSEKNIMIRKFIDVTGAGYPFGNPSPDGKYFAFLDWSSAPYGIVIKEIGTDKEIRLKNQGDLNHDGDKGTPYDLVWSPDSKQIAYTWENDEYEFCDLRVIEIGNSPPDVLIRVDYFENWVGPLDWSPDGNHILVLFSKKIQNQLGLVSITDSSFIPLKNLDHSNPTTAKFSPDGHYIAYDLPPNKESNKNDIYVLSIDGKQETRLTSHPSHDFLLDWTPSGEQILFASDRTGTTDLWSISVDGGTLQGKPELITNNVGLIGPMGCTQKGSLYFSTPGAWWDIYSVSIDPTAGKIIVPPVEIPLPYQGFNMFPAWSPDGKFLAYVSGRGREHQMHPRVPCIYSVETGLSKELAYQKDAIFPCWFPDSKHILLNGADVVDISTGEITQVIQLEEDEDDFIASITISPDGNYIYYVRENRILELHSINRKDLETGEIKELYRTPDECLTIALSPDGKQLVVQSRPDKNTRILKLLSTITGKEKQLHSFDVNEYRYISLAWSPDGRYIYFSKLSDQAELCRIPAAGGEAENLGVKMHNFSSLSVHPDGQQITFFSFIGLKQHGTIWVMDNFLPEIKATQ